ncbi:hypothetical protein KW507_15820 [Vibrio fluvialis]|nr:hypothetical protein [Vibrio fluvialis]
MKLKNILLIVVSAICATSSHAADWNFNAADFNKNGDVTINTQSGEVRTVQNGTSMYSTSTSPTVLNVTTSATGMPLPFKPVKRSITIRGDKLNVVELPGGYRYSYVAETTLAKKCLVKSVSLSARSNEGYWYDLLGDAIWLNGMAIRIPQHNSGFVNKGILDRSDYNERGVFETYDLRDAEWQLFKTYRSSSSSNTSSTLLYFDNPVLLETIKIGLLSPSVADWYSYYINYNCMSEFD